MSVKCDQFHNYRCPGTLWCQAIKIISWIISVFYEDNFMMCIHLIFPNACIGWLVSVVCIVGLWWCFVGKKQWGLWHCHFFVSVPLRAGGFMFLGCPNFATILTLWDKCCVCNYYLENDWKEQSQSWHDDWWCLGPEIQMIFSNQNGEVIVKGEWRHTSNVEFCSVTHDDILEQDSCHFVDIFMCISSKQNFIWNFAEFCS